MLYGLLKVGTGLLAPPVGCSIAGDTWIVVASPFGDGGVGG